MVVEIVVLGWAPAEVNRLRSAIEVRGTAVATPVVVGVAVPVFVAGVAWWYWRHRNRLSKWVRSVFQWAFGLTGAAMWTLFAAVHPRYGGETPPTSFNVASIAMTITVFLFCLVGAPIAAWRRCGDRGHRAHRPIDTTEVWHVRDRSKGGGPPYYIASCECGWFGEARDESTPGAEAAAFAEAKRHGTKLRPELAYPID